MLLMNCLFGFSFSYGKLEAPPPKSSATATNTSVKDVFEGQWRSDRFEGRGRVLYASGDAYEGQLRDGRPHGQVRNCLGLALLCTCSTMAN